MQTKKQSLVSFWNIIFYWLNTLQHFFLIVGPFSEQINLLNYTYIHAYTRLKQKRTNQSTEFSGNSSSSRKNYFLWSILHFYSGSWWWWRRWWLWWIIVLWSKWDGATSLNTRSPRHFHHHCILKLLRPISAFFSTHTSNNFRYLIAPYTIFCPVFLKPFSFSPVILINSTRLSERHQSKNEKKLGLTLFDQQIFLITCATVIYVFILKTPQKYKSFTLYFLHFSYTNLFILPLKEFFSNDFVFSLLTVLIYFTCDNQVKTSSQKRRKKHIVDFVY